MQKLVIFLGCLLATNAFADTACKLTFEKDGNQISKENIKTVLWSVQTGAASFTSPGTNGVNIYKSKEFWPQYLIQVDGKDIAQPTFVPPMGEKHEAILDIVFKCEHFKNGSNFAYNCKPGFQNPKYLVSSAPNSKLYTDCIEEDKGCTLEFKNNTKYENVGYALTSHFEDDTIAVYETFDGELLRTYNPDDPKHSPDTKLLNDLKKIDGHPVDGIEGAKFVRIDCRSDKLIKISACLDGYTPIEQYQHEPDFYQRCVKVNPDNATQDQEVQEETQQQVVETPEQQVSQETSESKAFSQLSADLNNMLTQHFAEGSSSKWKNDEGKFNIARLASDSIAGVVLGTTGGLVTSIVMKKNQVTKGFEDMKCTINGQNIADYGDTFKVMARP